MHTDAVQAFSWLDVAALTADVDLVTVSAHISGAPEGAGVLVARERVARPRPLLRGGPQERERCAGTQNVAGVVAMVAAAVATVRGARQAAPARTAA